MSEHRWDWFADHITESFDVAVRWVQVVMEQTLEITGMCGDTRENPSRVHIFQEKRKKVISFQMSPLSLIMLKPAVWCFRPYIQHCATAKNVSVPWNTPGPQSSSGKKTRAYGSNKKKKKVPPGYFLTLIWKDLDRQTVPNTSHTRENTFVPVYRLWGALTLSPRFQFGPQIEWKLNPPCFRRFGFNNPRSELHFAG